MKRLVHFLQRLKAWLKARFRPNHRIQELEEEVARQVDIIEYDTNLITGLNCSIAKLQQQNDLIQENGQIMISCLVTMLGDNVILSRDLIDMTVQQGVNTAFHEEPDNSMRLVLVTYTNDPSEPEPFIDDVQEEVNDANSGEA